MKLLCWNVAGRVRRLDEQADRIAAVAPDLVCLQGIRPTTVARWRQRLAEIGLSSSLTGDTAPMVGQGRSRPLLVLTAAGEPLSGQEVPGAPWPERVLAAHSPGGLLLVNLHSPISPKPDLAKVRTHEAVHDFLAAASGPALLCGDLNTPRKEHPDGRVWTFARNQRGKLLPERGERWDAAELALIKGLEPRGYRDAFRHLQGPEVRELSWEWPQWGGGYRLDHLIVSPGVQPRSLPTTAIRRWADFERIFEDEDQPVTALSDLESRVANVLQTLDPAVANGTLSMLGALTTYLAYRRDELHADDARLLRLAARAGWSGDVPDVVRDWLDARGVKY